MKNKSIRLVAVGDIFLGEHPVTLGHGVTSISRQYGCDFLFEKIKSYLEGDIVCGNLEGIISPKNPEEKGILKEIFWGDPTCAGAMREAGINCLFLANNHTAQHGRDALQRTCDLLDENDLKWTGFNPANPIRPIPAIFKVNGFTTSLLAYCDTQQYKLDTPLLPLIDFDNIKQDIDKAKTEADIIIISLHWGDEFINYPSPYQVELAHKIIDAGAHLILGHHPHIMQTVEQYKHGLIAYSLGSFIKDLWPRKLRESTILRCEINASGITKFDLVPILIHKKFHRPELYEGKAGKEYLAGVYSLSGQLEARNTQDILTQEIQYSKDVKQVLFHDRVATILHYFLNIHRYDKQLLFENVQLMVQRRLAGKNF
ncbi:MAG: CapA family protein [Desulfobulbaceae bacterium]|nr:CapA family protein [Desulfobulbaceae bacterium]